MLANPDIFRTCLAAFWVFIVQAGFALIATGFTRAKNASHTMLMNMMVFCIGFIAYYVCGFAFMFGGQGRWCTPHGANILDNMLRIGGTGGWGLLGTKGFFMSGLGDAQVLGFLMCQVLFMDTAATIPTGAMAERIKFSAFIWMSFFTAVLVYPILGCWVWGGGWLAQLGSKLGWGSGAVDFAGSGVVHMAGGWTALAGALALGPRIGKYGMKGHARPIPGHNIPLAILGTLILFFGWFGFNSGSPLAAANGALAVAALNTLLAGACGGLSAMLYMVYVHAARRPDPGLCCNGILAGLVAISAPCAFVSPGAAVIIGAVAGVWVVVAGPFVECQLRVDDPVGAFAVHGCSGLWGVLAVGLFACNTCAANGSNVVGVFPLGAPEGTPWFTFGQLKAQLVFALSGVAFVFGLQYAYLKTYNAIWGLRVSAEDELAGLDVPETGCPAYPDFASRDRLSSG
ncbi:MAG: ammonium transporter [Planctomycetota bacterium]